MNSAQTDKLNESAEAAEAETQPRSRLLFRIIGIIVLSLAILLAVYGTVVLLAWDRGQSLQRESIKQTLEEELASQLALAKEDLQAGNYNLALRRMEWILEQDPDYPGIASLQAEARSALDVLSLPTPKPLPESTPQVIETLPVDTEPARAYARLVELIEQEEWQPAVHAILAFQNGFPNFERRHTDSMLYEAYINSGQILLNGDQVELGLNYIAQAEKLGNLPSEVEDQRTWAEIYLLGIGYYGVDWGTAVYYFRDLCSAAPFYQNACVKLHEALISHGDVYALNLDWCPAEDRYAEAYQLNSESVVLEKLEGARQQCLEATPTPTIPITGTDSISGTSPVISDGY